MVRKIVLSVLLVVELLSIFQFSSQDSEKSSDVSGGVCEIIAKVLTPGFEELPEADREEIVASYQFTVRKGAHMAEFAILAATAFLFFIYVVPLNTVPALLAAMGFCAICSFFDELHQSFVPGRSMQMTDMLIDTGGGVAGALIAALVYRLICRRKSKRAAVKENSEV